MSKIKGLSLGNPLFFYEQAKTISPIILFELLAYKKFSNCN
ncbi:hypothetical protein J2Y60_002471 [Arcicella sp. BE140]|nr:hypothetical protein [Arcicella sp. BE51]MDR6812272.1 hypothetical protein [Arcicella sp. BE140]MDR6823603.1 hypothetical protein [Arcicella sp. BE139]